MKHKVRTATGRVATAAGVTAIAGFMAATPALAAGTNAGLALIVNPSNQTVNINTGGSQTPWTIKLPAGAACSGDTAGQAYHVYGYIVDDAANPDPGNLTFNSDGPVGSGTVFPLYDNTQTPYVNIATAINTGQIINIPTFNLDLFSIDGRGTANNPDGTLVLPAGVYDVGVACAHGNGAGDKYWNTKITVSSSGTDVNGESWATVPNPQVPEFPLSVALPLSAAGVLGTGYLVSRRRRRPTGVAALAG